MNGESLSTYFAAYKEKFDEIHDQERYKWLAIEHFQKKWDVEAQNFALILKDALARTENLFKSGHYFPRRMIVNLSKVEPDKVRALFKHLFNEQADLVNRMDAFRTRAAELIAQHFPDKKNHFQDHRAVIGYLSLKYPDRYFLYKFEMYKVFKKKLGYALPPRAGRNETVVAYLQMCEMLKEYLRADDDLIKRYRTKIAGYGYSDDSANLLTQDFVYAIASFLTVGADHENAASLIIEESTASADKYVARRSFGTVKTDYEKLFKEFKDVGNAGEQLVLEYEIQKLIKAGLKNLAKKVVHVSALHGDGAGYDIESYNIDGSQIYIEVKTTVNSCSTPFFVTQNELERSKQDSIKYRLYRLYFLDKKNMTAKFQIISGSLSPLCDTPSVYQVRLP